MTTGHPSEYRPELLAPAGNRACLQAALDAGCSAVYFGLEHLNMRAAAGNFTAADLPEIHRQCRRYGVKAYLTLNTIIYVDELETAAETVQRAKPYIDAVICWDPAVIQICREHGVPVHLSTQASVSNPRAAAFYRDLGVERIVLARECTLPEIMTIQREAGIEVEVFVHGAMCVSVSGRCFLSQFTHGKSGNRGECWQNCRREYRIYGDDGVSEFLLGTDYVMSARDLCTLPFLDRLLNAGIDAFKIEGRNRPPEYVATVTAAYRRGIDAWRDGQYSPALAKELEAECRTVFNRDFSDGFFLGRPIHALTDRGDSQATLRKDHVGRILNYYRKAQTAHILIQNHNFEVGDHLLITGPTTGVVQVQVCELREDEPPPDKPNYRSVTIPLDQRVRVNDLVYRLSERTSEPPDDRHRKSADCGQKHPEELS